MNKLLLTVLLFITTFTQNIKYSPSSTTKFFKNNIEIEYPLSGGFHSLYTQFIDIDNDSKDEMVVLNRGFVEPLVFNFSKDQKVTIRSIKFTSISLLTWFYFTDIDNDGDLDVYTLDQYGDIGYQLNSGSFEYGDFIQVKNMSNNFISPETGSIPVLFDFDEDGSLDLFMTTQTSGTINYMKNNGSFPPIYELIDSKFGNISVISGQTSFSKSSTSAHGKSSFAFFDQDKDGDYDVLWSDMNQRDLFLLENVGDNLTPTYNPQYRTFPDNISLSNLYTFNLPVIYDMNSDGKKDIILNPQFDPFFGLQLFLATNDPNKFDHATTELISTVDAGAVSAVQYIDMNNDGRKDIVFSTVQDNNFEFNFQVYLNEVDGFHYDSLLSELNLPWFGQRLLAYDFQFVDYNRDDLLDLIILDDNGELFKCINSGTISVPVFATIYKIKDNSGDDYIGNEGSFKLWDLDGDGNLELITVNRTRFLNVYKSVNGIFDTLDKQYEIESTKWTRHSFWVNENKSLMVHSNFELFELVYNRGITFKDAVRSETTFPKIDGIVNFDNISKNELLIGHANGGLLIFSKEESSTVPVTNDPIGVYPNPSFGKQQIKLNMEMFKSDVSFYNILGQRIKVDVVISNDKLEWTLPSYLSNGIYFLRLKNETYKIIRLRN